MLLVVHTIYGHKACAILPLLLLNHGFSFLLWRHRDISITTIKKNTLIVDFKVVKKYFNDALGHFKYKVSG